MTLYYALLLRAVFCSQVLMSASTFRLLELGAKPFVKQPAVVLHMVSPGPTCGSMIL